MRFSWKRAISAVTFLLAFVAVAIVVHAVQQLTLERVLASLSRVGWQHIGWALLCTAGSYLALTGFDWIGTRYAGGRLPYHRIAIASFLSLSIGHTVGFSPFSSGAVRYRYYSQWGLRNDQIGQIILLSVVTVTLGETTLSAIVLLGHRSFAQKVLGIAPFLSDAIGILCATVVISYAACAFLFQRRPILIFGRRFRFPRPGLALGQIGVGLLNYVFVAGVLHFLLLAAVAPIDFFTTTTAFILGNLTALLSHVPGGLGVLEATIALLLPNIDAIGPLIAFRCVYYLVPLALGLTLLGIMELRAHFGRRQPQSRLHSQP